MTGEDFKRSTRLRPSVALQQMMTKVAHYPAFGQPRHRIGAAKPLAVFVALLLPAMVGAQSTPLPLLYKKFEQAQEANDFHAAEIYGRSALIATEGTPGGDPHDLIDLLRSLGDVSAKAGDDQQAVDYYQRALAKQESVLGLDHPDLVPVLAALADLATKDKRYPDAAALLQRILKIERVAYGERHENVLATLKQLRDTYRAAADTEAAARIDLQIEQFGSTAKGFSDVAAAPGKDRRYKMGQGYATVRVFYGTDRKSTGSPKPGEFYGAQRGDLQYGYLDVTIPAAHQEAELETRSQWDIVSYFVSAAGLRTRYVLLDKVTPLARDGFLSALQKQIKEAPSKDVFIFVHGFNSTFEDAARRCAQLAYDLDFDGTPMMYSWASAGSATAYIKDEATVTASGRKMAQMLDDVVARSGAERIHLIAHSMGNRALIEALQTYLAARDTKNRQRIFDQIIFTAPDVDREYFVGALDSLTGTAARVTLYASNTDLALQSSQILHDAPRAGLAGVNIISMSGLDTIDMSAVPADELGHSYFASNAGAIYDLFRLFWRGDPPPDRCGMSGRKPGGLLSVWLFNVDICKGDDLLEAGVMLKRLGAQAKAQVQANIQALTDPTEKQQWKLVLNRLNTLLAPGAELPPDAAGAAK
jgi:esterase/lipase superfamily enzyme